MSTVVVQTECVPTRRCDEGALIEIVERAMHPSTSEWLFLRELRVGTGRQNGGAQRLDAFACQRMSDGVGIIPEWRSASFWNECFSFAGIPN